MSFCGFWVYALWRNETRFERRLAALSGVYAALIAAISEFYASVQPNYLVAAQITIAVLVQITSIVLFLTQLGHREKHEPNSLI